MARGDDEFVEFAQASSGRLLHAAFLLTGDRHQAEDAAQSALVRTYAAWSRVRRKDAYAYARTVLTNLVTDGWRRPYRENATEFLPERATNRDLAEDVTRRQWLVGALAVLSARERVVIVLRYFFDMTEADVAQELDVSLGTVKSLNSRGLAKLRVTADAEPAVPHAGDRNSSTDGARR
jgi:RNA polymerase sigma-70 factor (sigma-E family)